MVLNPMIEHKRKEFKLSPKVIRFCHEYVIEFNGKQSAINAKYSERSAETQASRMLRREKVKAYIQGLIDEINQRSKVSADDIRKGIKDTIDEGNKVGNLSVVLRGWELLGKDKGMFVERVELGRVGEFEDASQEEIEVAIAEFKEGEQMNAENKEPKRLSAGSEGEGSEDQKEPTPILPTVH